MTDYTYVNEFFFSPSDVVYVLLNNNTVKKATILQYEYKIFKKNEGVGELTRYLIQTDTNPITEWVFPEYVFSTEAEALEALSVTLNGGVIPRSDSYFRKIKRFGNAVRVDFTIFAGDFYERTFTLKETGPDGVEVPLDIQNMFFQADIKQDYDDTIPIATFDITKDVSESSITLFLSSSVTSTLPAGDYVYDLEMWEDPQKIKKLIYGTITIKPEVTIQ